MRVFALILVIAGCHDDFRCGVRVNNNVQNCNGSSEVCICDMHRCAVPNGSCESGFEYTRKQYHSPDCVPAANRWRRVTGANLCPGEENQEILCGVAGGTACPMGSQCVCNLQRCVQKVIADRCASQLVWQSTQQCITDEVKLSDLDRYHPKADGSCPEVNPSPGPECGLAALGGSVLKCTSPSQCSCREFQCMSAVPLVRCPSGYEYSATGRCVGDTGAAAMCAVQWGDGMCIDMPYPASIEQTFLGSRDSCAQPRPPESSCGAVGSPVCPSGQVCVCTGPTPSPFRCAKQVESDRCANGLAWSYDGLCVDPEISLDRQRYFVPQSSNNVCPELAGAPAKECGFIDQGQLKWCANAGDVCFCPTKRCVVQVPTRDCDSGYAYRSDGRCVERLVSTAMCPSGRAWPQDGTCIDAPVAEEVGARVQAMKDVCPGVVTDAGIDMPAADLAGDGGI
jgi:hypothetical protein